MVKVFFSMDHGLLFGLLMYILKFDDADVINHFPFPKFLAFSFNGSFTVFILDFCRTVSWLLINSDPRHVS